MAKPDYESWSGCPMRYSMGILGDRWSLLIVRDIIFNGYSKYGDFLTNGEGISTTVLADRLARLERSGILSKIESSEAEARPYYLLTKKGLDLVPVILQFILWAANYDEHSDVSKEHAEKIRSDPEGFRRSIEEKVMARCGLAGS